MSHKLFYEGCEDLKETLEKIIKKEGRALNLKELREKGFEKEATAIQKAGGLKKMYSQIDLSCVKKTCKTKKNLREQLAILWLEFPLLEGTLPPEDWLINNGYKHIVSSIQKYHKGFINTRKALGLKVQKGCQSVNYGEIEKWETILHYMQEIQTKFPHQKEKLPSRNWLKENGYSFLETAFSRYHGGRRKVREKLNITQVRTEDGYWQEKKNILEKLKTLQTENRKEDVVSTKWLSENGHSSLASEIHSQFGMHEIRKILGLHENQKPKGFWQNKDNFHNEFLRIMNLYDKIPSTNQLLKDGYSPLVQAAKKYYGGINKVKIKLGLFEEDTSTQDLEELLNQYVGGENE